MILIIFMKNNCQIGTFSEIYTCAYVLCEELGAGPLAFPSTTQPFNQKGNCRKREAM